MFKTVVIHTKEIHFIFFNHQCLRTPHWIEHVLKVVPKINFLKTGHLNLVKKKKKSCFFYEMFKFQFPLCFFLKFKQSDFVFAFKGDGFYLALQGRKTYNLIIIEQTFKCLVCAGHQGCKCDFLCSQRSLTKSSQLPNK